MTGWKSVDLNKQITLRLLKLHAEALSPNTIMIFLNLWPISKLIQLIYADMM